MPLIFNAKSARLFYGIRVLAMTYMASQLALPQPNVVVRPPLVDSLFPVPARIDF